MFYFILFLLCIAGLVFSFFMMLLAGPVMSDNFEKKQDALDQRLVRFIAENYDALAAGQTLDYYGKSLHKDSRLTRYRYCYSAFNMTESRSSALFPAEEYYRDEEAKNAKMMCQLITAISGWWNIPWGIIHSIRFLVSNGVRNGTNDDSVDAVMSRPAVQAQQEMLAQQAQQAKQAQGFP